MAKNMQGIFSKVEVISFYVGVVNTYQLGGVTCILKFNFYFQNFLFRIKLNLTMYFLDSRVTRRLLLV